MRRVEVRLARYRSRNRAWAENIAIAALALLAVFLAGRTGMLQDTLPTLSGTQTVAGGYSTGPAVSLAGGSPVRLMIRNGDGRYGVEYNRDTVELLYHQGLLELLDGSLRGMETPEPVQEEVWQKAITDGERWVFYDYLDTVIFDQRNDQEIGAGRFFLVTEKGGKVEQVLYYNEGERTFYRGRLREQVDYPSLVLSSNGAAFAFEEERGITSLSPYMMVMDSAPACLVCQAANPVQTLEADDWMPLVEALDFNAKAASPYTTATGSVIREGADTLRVMNDGTLQFHGSDTGENRYAALSEGSKDLQLKAEEILDRATQGVRGPAALSCRSIRTLEDGQTEVLFDYLLDGARVQLWGEGWAARFLFRDNVVTAYTILLRTYVATEESSTLLPVRQAAAAAAAMGRQGAELQVVYPDNGGDRVSAVWTVREPR